MSNVNAGPKLTSFSPSVQIQAASTLLISSATITNLGNFPIAVQSRDPPNKKKDSMHEQLLHFSFAYDHW